METQKLSKKEREAKDSIDIAFDFKNRNEWLETGNRLLDAYKGQIFESSPKEDTFVFNSTFSNVNLLLPNLVLNEPYIKVRPINPTFLRTNVMGEYESIDNIKASVTFESAINHEFKTTGALREIQKAIQDSFFWGFGLLKNGYSFETVATEEEDIIREDTTFSIRVNPRDFGFHPMATSVNDASVLIHRIVTTKEALKKNPEYKGIEDLKSSVPERFKDKFKNLKSFDSNFITIWEVHDQENDMIYTFGGEQKKLIWKRENPYSFSGSHFSMVKFASDPDEFIGIPLLFTVEDESHAMNEVLTKLINHLHMFAGQVIYQEGAIDDDDIRRFQEGGQGAILSAKDITLVQKHPPVPMGSDYINALSVLQGLMDRTLGIPDFQRAASNQRKSASEAAFIQGDVNVRREYLLSLVKDFLLDSIRKKADLMKQFFDNKRYILAEGSVSQDFIEYTKDDIQGEYQFDFDLVTLRGSNSTEVQQLINGLNIMAAHPALVPILQTLDPLKLGKEIFKKMGLNIESFQIKDLETQVFISPDKENMIVMSPESPAIKKFKGIIPDPKKGENHDEHLESHALAREQLLLSGRPTDELDRHIRLTFRLKDEKDALQNPSIPVNPEAGPGPQPTEGPVNLPGQPLAGRAEPQ